MKKDMRTEGGGQMLSVVSPLPELDEEYQNDLLAGAMNLLHR